MKKLLVAAVAAVVSCGAFAKDVYISPDGDQATADGSIERPYQDVYATLHQNAKIATGDTVWFMDGTHVATQYVYVTVSVTFKAVNPGKAILTMDSSRNKRGFFYSNNDSISYDGLVFRDITVDLKDGGGAIFSGYDKILNCRFEDGRILSSNWESSSMIVGKGNLVSNCTFVGCISKKDDCPPAILNTKGSARHPLVVDCVFTNCVGVGRGMVWNSSEVRHCQIQDCVGGVFMDDRAKLVDTDFTACTAAVTYVNWCSGAKSNIVSGCTFVGLGTASNQTGANCLRLGTFYTVTNCVFTGIHGTAIGNSDRDTHGTIVDCHFTNGTSRAVYVTNVSQPGTARPTVVKDCTFFGNVFPTKSNQGGAGVCSMTGPLVCERCEFVGNRALSSYGGAVYSGGYLSMTNCTVWNNSANISGGVQCGDFSTISDCLIKGCESTGSIGGVGLGTDSAVINTAIVNNKAGSSTGGLSCGARFHCRNLLIAENYAGNQPAAASLSTGSIWENCTVVSNLVAKGCPGLQSDGASNVSVTNCFVAMNYVVGKNTGSNFYCAGSHILSKCVLGSEETSKGSQHDSEYVVLSDKDATPATYGLTADYRPAKFRSPLVDQGANADWMDGATDLGKKNARILGKRVDIGCYEYMPLGLMLLLR